jgi:hypothetical protein
VAHAEKQALGLCEGGAVALADKSEEALKEPVLLVLQLCKGLPDMIGVALTEAEKDALPHPLKLAMLRLCVSVVEALAE